MPQDQILKDFPIAKTKNVSKFIKCQFSSPLKSIVSQLIFPKNPVKKGVKNLPKK